jgi:pimeloyl-ACP methyl ester carboxylesterase
MSSRAALALVALLAACGGSGSVSSAELPSLEQRCGSESVADEGVWFRANDGTLLDGYLIGRGDVTVVLAHEFPGGVCNPLPYALALAREGYRVFTFDFRGRGLSQAGPTNDLPSDLIGAVEELRDRGADSVFLVGASVGAAAALVAASRLDRKVDGVISLSGEYDLGKLLGSRFADVRPVVSVRRLRAPLLIAVARFDRFLSVTEARALVRRASSRQKRLLVLPGVWHGWDLVESAPYAPRVRAAILRFLRRYADS